MLDVNLNDTEPKHVERIEPQITVDDSGNIIWVPSLLDYDASVFHRGKTVTNKEFNNLFLRQLYQGNYITDSLVKFLKDHLSTAIHRKFTSTYKLVTSYTKVFTSEDWSAVDENGYAYITVPVEEHGFKPVEDATGRGMNIDTELYLLNADGRFYEIDQITTDPDNTVQIYTDDTSVMGFVVIRSNERSYAITGATVSAEDITGLATVARTGLYTDLFGTPDLSGINVNAEAINKIVDGTTAVGNAQNTKNVTESIGGQALNIIFETGSSVVKNATTAKNYISGGGIDDKFKEVEQSIYTNTLLLQEDIRTINARLDALGFKEGVASYEGFRTPYDYSSSLKKQGKYVLFDFSMTGMPSYYPLLLEGETATITIPSEFCPKTDTQIFAFGQNYNTVGASFEYYHRITVTTSGRIEITQPTASSGSLQMTSFYIETGWETN